MEEVISPAQVPLRTEQAWTDRLFPNNEWILVIVIAVECLIFALTGSNFATAGNAFEISRLSVEIGLLALIMTPIIITGGIDLSVGSMMGLSAVVMGALWRDAGMSMPVAIGITLLVGLLGGCA
jgi:rhamnose transport system permease protein